APSLYNVAPQAPCRGGAASPSKDETSDDGTEPASPGAGPAAGPDGAGLPEPWRERGRGSRAGDVAGRRAALPFGDGRGVRRLAPVRRRLRGADATGEGRRLLPLPGRPRRPGHLLRPDGAVQPRDPRPSRGDPDPPSAGGARD